MQTILPDHKPMRMVVVVLVSAGLGLLFSSGFSFLACSGGFLFSDISALFVTIAATAVCVVATSITALLLRRRQKHLRSHALLLVVLVSTFFAVSILSFLDTLQHMRIFMAPSPVPSALRVHHGRNVLFRSFVHFTGPPLTIAALLQSKGLIEVPAEPPESSDYGGFGSRERTKVSWGWWQPISMPNARFYALHHKTETPQGWSEGWWVSGATNEVYAFIAY